MFSKFNYSDKKFFYVVLGIFILAIFTTACSDNSAQNSAYRGSDKEDDHAAEEKEMPEIALVMKTLTNPFFAEMELGARRAEEEFNIKLIVKTAAQETSIQQQINIVENLISIDVDAIVIAPGDSVDLIPVLKQAQDKGIVVVNIDNRLDANYSKSIGLKEVPFISVDNEQAAYLSAKALTNKLTEPTSVVILEGIRTASNAQERKRGAIKAFEESAFVNLVASETANWKIDEAFAVTKSLFEQYPTIGAIFCANDMMALGTIEYLRSIGKEDVLVASFDALVEAKKAIRIGALVATVDQQAAEQGYLGVQTALHLLNEENQESVVYVEAKVITIENVN